MKLYYATTFLKRLKGLLGRKALSENEVLLISPCNSVHTFGMRFPVCVIFLGSQNQVLKIVPSLRPWRFCFCLHASCVLELTVGLVNNKEQAALLLERIFSE